METYLQQLLQDIAAAAAATDPEEVPFDGPDPDTFEAHIWEVERYLHDDPNTTLGQYLRLEQVQFPDEGQLTNEQCAALTEALEETFFTYGVMLEIPDGIPIRLRYRAAVEALDKAVFISNYGHVVIEYCHYDFDGYCPFGMERCPCYVQWEQEVREIKSGSDFWMEKSMNRLSVTWYELLNRLAEAGAQFEATPTLNRQSVQTLCGQLDKTWLAQHRDDYSVWYKPKPEEVPNTPGRTLLGWAGFPDAVFPPFGQLHPMEAELLTLAMLRLLGKELILLSAMELEQPQQYEALTRHLSCELRKDETVDHFRFLCPPGQPHIYDLTRMADEEDNIWNDEVTRDLPF